MQRAWDKEILELLYDYFIKHSGDPAMPLSDLHQALNVSGDDKDVALALFTLENRNRLIKRRLVIDGSLGLIEINPDGIKSVQNQHESPGIPPASKSEQTGQGENNGSPALPPAPDYTTCPQSLQDLIALNEDCKRIIRREKLVSEIRKRFTSPDLQGHFIVLSGEPMVGKTELLNRLATELGDDYVVLLLIGHAFNAVNSIDAFTYDLALQLTNQLREWAENRISLSIANPQLSHFTDGNGFRAFYNHWGEIRRLVGNRRLIVTFDEMEHLLDYRDNVSPEIFIFLDSFLRDPRNGYFIVAGSEKMERLKHIFFKQLIGKGETVRIGHYEDGTFITVFRAIQDYITYEEEFLQYFSAICNGHPRFLRKAFETIVTAAIQTFKRNRLGKSDIAPVLDALLMDSHNFLEALYSRLSQEEYIVAWLYSKQVADLPMRLELSRYELEKLAAHYLDAPHADVDILTQGLSKLQRREWIEHNYASSTVTYRFKFGIFPLWLQRYEPKFTEKG
jgi:hypothetical protein